MAGVKRRLVVGALALAVAGLGALAVTDVLRGEGAPAAAPTSGLVDTATSARASALLDSFAALDEDPTYGGLRILRAPDAIEVSVRGAPSAAVDERVARMRGTGFPVRVRPVVHSLDELSALRDEVTAHHAAWLSRGVDIMVVGPDVGANRVSIGLRHRSDRAVAQLVDAYGADRVTVEAQGVDISGS